MTRPPLSLHIDPAALAAIRAHAERTYPHECCGALLGAAADGRFVEVLALPNSTEEGPRRRFLIRPGDYLAAERDARARRLDLVGFYHSHPDHPARPSQHDLAQAWPTLHYLIASVVDGRTGDVRDWLLAADRSAFEEVVLGDASARATPVAGSA
jgi:proteasome lid subunit RPN8/RPN11